MGTNAGYITGVHSSKETPPQVLMITGSTPHHPPVSQKKDIQERIISTAAAVVKAAVTQNSPSSSMIQSPQINQTVSETTAPQKGLHVGVSPGKILKSVARAIPSWLHLKQLYEDGVLTLNEFEEQKQKILSGLKKFQ